ncbi:MAG: N-formylglutamate deformylase [Novosphingobium sp.]
MSDILDIHRGDLPLIIAFPHGGSDLAGLEFASPWAARLDADWWIAEVHAFARAMGATMIATRISRSVIDCNRDPSGASLYPGQATTGLVPPTTCAGDPLCAAPCPEEIARRRSAYFEPYHHALAGEIARLRAVHGRVVLYDAHSIRSRIPRLFEGELPQFNIGTNGGASCAAELEAGVAQIAAASGYSHVLNGRFKGGWTTRHYGRPEHGVHAIQMELAMRGYLAEPEEPDETNWPAPIDTARSAALAPTLHAILAHCLAFAKGQP